ncbi:Knottin, scorpion toxin-like, partial [Parasponia andersonii]
MIFILILEVKKWQIAIYIQVFLVFPNCRSYYRSLFPCHNNGSPLLGNSLMKPSKEIEYYHDSVLHNKEYCHRVSKNFHGRHCTKNTCEKICKIFEGAIAGNCQ